MPTTLLRLDDEGRLAALRASGLLDTPPEEAFDRLTSLATRALEIPVALVTLVDGDRQFFKSCVGLPEPWASRRETPLSHSFCQYTVVTGEPLVIEDAREHPELRHNLAIPDLGVVAYAGYPLATADGYILGTFCAIDHRPRRWTERELGILRDLAASAATEIELRLTIAAAARSADQVERLYLERDELLDASTDGIYTIDLDGVCHFANRCAAEMLGYRREELVGRNAHSLLHHSRPDGTPYPEAECPILRATRAGEAQHVYEDVLWRRDGTPLMVGYASSPLRRGGAVVGAVVRFTDVAESRRAAAATRLLSEAGRVLAMSLDLDSTLQAIARVAVPQLAEMAMVDVIDDGQVRRVAASHADARSSALFERARQHPPRLDEDGPQSRVIRTGQPLFVREIDAEWIDRTGRGEEHRRLLHDLVPRSLIVVPLPIGPAVRGTLSLVRTGTRPPFEAEDLPLAEELGRRAALAVENARLYDAARRATRARDDMIGVVSHDLRNPIHAAIMGASFLLELLPPESTIERTQAEVIKRALERANRLIQDLLDITHIEAGRMTIDCHPQRVGAIVDEALEQTRILADKQGLALDRGAVDDDALVLADRDRVLQALGNLLGNAFKFTPAGGRVTLSARATDDTVRLSVTDTGPGIPAQQRPRLFDRFWQASRTDRRGVGLGLSIVKGIAEAHGGEVQVESTPGQGATFTLVLPAAPSGQRPRSDTGSRV